MAEDRAIRKLSAFNNPGSVWRMPIAMSLAPALALARAQPQRSAMSGNWQKVVCVSVDGSGMESERQRSPRVQTGFVAGAAAIKSWTSCSARRDF